MYLCDNGIEDFVFERSEDDGLVLDRVDDKSLSGLDEAGPDVVDRRDGDDEAVLARARALHLREQLLFHGVHKLWPKVSRGEHDLVVEANVEEHSVDGSYFCTILLNFNHFLSDFL